MRPLLILLPALLLPGCKETRGGLPPPGAEKVRAAAAAEETFVPAVETFGSLVYSAKADVYSAVEGRVEALHAEEGDRVGKGTLLASVAKDALLLAREKAESAAASREADLRLAGARLREGRKEVEARLFRLRMAEADIALRKAEHANIRSIYENKKKLFLAGGVPAGELEAAETRFVTGGISVELAEIERDRQMVGFRESDIREAGFDPPENPEALAELLVALNTVTLEAEKNAAEAELAAARADLRRADLLLAEADVRSPIAGVVSRRGVETGETASPDTLLFSVFSVEKLFAVADIGEKDLLRVSPGMEAEVAADSFSALPGRVRLVSPYVNPATKSAEVRVEVDNPSGKLRPGMFVRVKIFAGAPGRRLRVPASSLVEDGDGGYSVLVVRNSRVFRTRIDTSGPEGGFAVVEKGLSPGDLVVEKPSPSLRDGTLVEVVP